MSTTELSTTTIFCVSHDGSGQRFFTSRQLAEQWIEQHPMPHERASYWTVSEWDLHTHPHEVENDLASDETVAPSWFPLVDYGDREQELERFEASDDPSGMRGHSSIDTESLGSGDEE